VEQQHSEEFSMQKMLADYMEDGLLENIVDMFKHDDTLYKYIPGLMKDERLRVRIGTIALLETLAQKDMGNRGKAVQSITPLLKDENSLVQGDAAYILGLIGDKETIPFLEEIIDSNDANVRTIAQEAIQDIRSRQ
jgi:HEAT repeat protein